MKRVVAFFSMGIIVLVCVGCSNPQDLSGQTSSSQSNSIESVAQEVSIDTNGAWECSLKSIDMTKWQYDAQEDVYWQVGLSYCSNPADETLESLGVFVPGAYFDGIKNNDGTYTCTIDNSASVKGYTADTAPIVLPVNTPGHKAQDAPTSFAKGCATYTKEGYVYVVAGCRGKDAGVPAGVADLKAAIRYIRMCAESLPGSIDRIVAFGHSGGGSQSAVLGASGDSALYAPYLAKLGAAKTSDAIAAVMSWCPITSYDTSDWAYEWNMGLTRQNLSQEMTSISQGLASAYAQYVNKMGFVDKTGTPLTLAPSSEGMYQSGTYYEYVKGVIEHSLENYLVDTTFPTSGKSGSYSSAEEYIASLNENGAWVTYNSATGKVEISSIAAFVEHFKKATKPLAAFDKLEEGGHELFNTGDGQKTHFDTVLYELAKETEYATDLAEDLSKTDFLGNSMEYRLNMFSPLYYLMKSNEGFGTAQVATHWRIRSGINQTDTALTTEINLALALEALGGDVDFATVWGQGHTQAERTGNYTSNFIAWVNEICATS